MFALIHQLCQFLPAGAKLIGNLAPGFTRRWAVWSVEGLADRGRHGSVPTARDMCRSAPHPVNAAPLPGGLEDPLCGRPETAVG